MRSLTAGRSAARLPQPRPRPRRCRSPARPGCARRPAPRSTRSRSRRRGRPLRPRSSRRPASARGRRRRRAEKRQYSYRRPRGPLVERRLRRMPQRRRHPQREDTARWRRPSPPARAPAARAASCSTVRAGTYSLSTTTGAPRGLRTIRSGWPPPLTARCCSAVRSRRQRGCFVRSTRASASLNDRSLFVAIRYRLRSAAGPSRTSSGSGGCVEGMVHHDVRQRRRERRGRLDAAACPGELTGGRRRGRSAARSMQCITMAHAGHERRTRSPSPATPRTAAAADAGQLRRVEPDPGEGGAGRDGSGWV